MLQLKEDWVVYYNYLKDAYHYSYKDRKFYIPFKYIDDWRSAIILRMIQKGAPFALYAGMHKIVGNLKDALEVECYIIDDVVYNDIPITKLERISHTASLLETLQEEALGCNLLEPLTTVSYKNYEISEKVRKMVDHVLLHGSEEGYRIVLKAYAHEFKFFELPIERE